MARAFAARGRWPAAFALAASALAIGAVLATPHDGQATSTAAPSNTATPTISGTPQENQTLSADHGNWTGSPTSYDYAWSRCDKNGDGCKSIDSATSATYQLQQADVSHTLRVTVTAHNVDGAGVATSAPSAQIAAASPPSNTSVPTTSGTVQIGSTLTGDNGTWSGNPDSYAYSWSRCDENGGSCSAIGGATTQTYSLKQVDAGTTLRFSVTATNSAGSTTAISAPTALVPNPSTYTPPAVTSTGCPDGSGVVQVADVSPPARLAIDQQTVAPGVVTLAAASIQTHFRVTACGGRPVQGALVYVTAIPYNQYSIPPEATTGADGTVTVTLTQQGGFPASRAQRLLVVFVRARKAGEPLEGGISTRLLVSFPVSVGG